MKNSDMPAMPVMPVMDEADYGQHYGLTKREHFAAMAMQGLAASGNRELSRDVAFLAVAYADALLAELEK